MNSHVRTKAQTFSLFCAHCKTPAPKAVGVSVGHSPETGSLFVCWVCGEVSELKDSGWEPLTHDQVNSLPEDERKDIYFAIRRIKEKLQQN